MQIQKKKQNKIQTKVTKLDLTAFSSLPLQLALPKRKKKEEKKGKKR